jgi:hypothetical protein
MWLPAASRGGVQVSFMDVPQLVGLSWGIVIIGLVLAALIYLGKKATDIVGLVLSIIALLFSLLFLTVALEDGGAAISMGVYAMVVGSAGTLIGIIMNMIARKKAK